MRYLLKYILSFVVIILFSNILLAQGGYISLYQAGLNITLQDGKIPYKNDNKTTDVSGFVTFTKNIPDSLECNVSAIFVHRSTTGTETTISDSIRVSNSEFRTSISIPKNFTFKLQPNKKAGQVILRFKYYKKNYPNTTNGWSGMESGKTWQTVELDTVPPTSFNGPSQICNEGIYTITNPGTITLENATGIATLTSLGNNQWKVTRTGTANGEVNLKSTSNGKIVEKSIVIGTVTKGNIAGNAAIQLGESQIYTLALNGNTDYNWSVSYNPNITWTKQSATSIKLSTTGSVPMGWSENITISAQAVGSCGTASNYISKTIKFVNERDPRLD